MLVSAVVLVANTLRMGMFARRKEISIMRLVGATNWRIRVPFLIEGGRGGAGRRRARRSWRCSSGRSSSSISCAGKLVWLPLVRNSDVLAVVPWIIIAAIVVAAIAGTIGMRRFLDV